ncbi:hypothetical protein RJT34_12928 [Clitoria ternatea]|uniref:Uncharacterized protein n=1 Tax=Clitoria ternatea TaxID=43366 RepID=A0AAN9JR67_CLITE
MGTETPSLLEEPRINLNSDVAPSSLCLCFHGFLRRSRAEGTMGIFRKVMGMFDVEYARWIEEHHRIVCELRAAVQEHLPENKLRLFVDNCLAHYDQE